MSKEAWRKTFKRTQEEILLAIRPWKLISSKKDGSFRIFGLRTDRAVSPRTNKGHDFYVLESPGWVNVTPLTRQEEVVLVRQYRHGIRQVTLEIPGDRKST